MNDEMHVRIKSFVKAVFHWANFIARSDFFFSFEGHPTVTNEKPIEFTQKNSIRAKKICVGENSL